MYECWGEKLCEMVKYLFTHGCVIAITPFWTGCKCLFILLTTVLTGFSTPKAVGGNEIIKNETNALNNLAHAHHRFVRNLEKNCLDKKPNTLTA